MKSKRKIIGWVIVSPLGDVHEETFRELLPMAWHAELDGSGRAILSERDEAQRAGYRAVRATLVIDANPRRTK